VEASKLLDIDSIMHFAIAEEATPGGQVLIARRGNVIYSKEFGHHTYDQSRPVEWQHLYDLASNFGIILGSELATHTGVNLAVPPISNIKPASNTTIAGTTDNIISFDINFVGNHGMNVNPIIQFKVEDGDIFEILGGNRIRDSADKTTPSVDCDATSVNTKVSVQCYYNAQLSSQQNVYLRTTTNTTNIQTSSFNSGNTDTPNINMMENSRILGKVIIDDEFATFTSGTQMEYFLNLTTKSITFLDLFITDSHGRDIPFTTKGSNSQATLGNRSFECIVKVDVVQYLGLQNNMLPYFRKIYLILF
jgi:hypothetical protein